MTRLEQSEVKRKITLESLDKVANSLDCDVYYFLVPRLTLNDILKERVNLMFQKENDAARQSMALEDQLSSENSRREAILKAIETLKLSRKLWDD